MGLEAAKSGAFVLRFFELITSIVAFACVADYTSGFYWSNSKINFMIFTGVTGMILALVFMLLYCIGARGARGIVSFVLDAIWTIFWLAAAACVSNLLASGVDTSKMKASVAFGWISFFLWVGSTVISFQDWRGGVSGPPPAGPAGPTIPQSASVSMV